MQTLQIVVDSHDLQTTDDNTSTLARQNLARMGQIINQGELVAFPTETVYGLGANALNPQAVSKIFQAKGRPGDNPLIVHIAHQEDLAGLVAADFLKAKSVQENLKKLTTTFWPGPLTLVMPATVQVPKEVTAGLDTVAVRMPDHPIALGLIEAACAPIAAPSANLSGKPSPISAAHVLQDLDGKIDAVIDGGPVAIGVESTVLDLTTEPPTLLRPGGVTLEALEDLLGSVAIDPALTAEGRAEKVKPRAPGLKYTHYAPDAKVVLVEGEPQQIAHKIRVLATKYVTENYRVGILASEESRALYLDLPQVEIIVAGSHHNLSGVAAGLYGFLREFDHLGVEIIFVEGYSSRLEGLAIMNRLRKASGYNIIKV